MRLLLDENLSEALIARLADTFPDVLHVRTLGLGGASDSAIWSAARERDALLVTRDEDFRHFSIQLGAPPKVVWIGLPNCSTAEAVKVLSSKEAAIGSSRTIPTQPFWPSAERLDQQQLSSPFVNHLDRHLPLPPASNGAEISPVRWSHGDSSCSVSDDVRPACLGSKLNENDARS